MSLAEARKQLDDLVHSPVRFSVMSILSSVEQADYQTIREELDLSYALLSKHAAILEEVGYLDVVKEFASRTPRTHYRLTPLGRRAYARHLATLDELVQGLAR